MAKKKAKIEKISKWELKVTYWGELAERELQATDEEKELLVAEAEAFEDCIKEVECCESSEDCPNPTPWCCKKCPSKLDELRAKYRELDDDFDDVLEPKKCYSIAGCPMCWETILVIVVVLLLLYMWLK